MWLLFWLVNVSFWFECIFCASLPNNAPAFGGKIKHVVALMFENRAFDHMLGYLRTTRPEIDGCLPNLGVNCSNPLDPAKPKQDLVYVSNDAVYIQPGDPSHSLPGTTFQEFGTNDNGNDLDLWPPPMNGFVNSYSHHETTDDDGAFIMKCFDSSQVPIITSLANEFAVCDQWFADVPGPTSPNRLYAMMGSSHGLSQPAGTSVIAQKGFVGPNIFHMMDEYTLPEVDPQILPWRVYFGDAPCSLLLDYVRLHPDRFGFMHEFYEDLKQGTLPLFTWMEPMYFDHGPGPLERAKDQHPDHDVQLGEQLMKDVYEAIRASSVFNETLLVIYYDEHGGFFDHVPPPVAPNPDGKNATQPPFDFQRLGVRVPAIFVSPYTKKGSLLKPTKNGEPQYSHSSLLHTLREQWLPDAPAMSKREDWSLTVESVISLDEPRTDCPSVLPDIKFDEGNQYVHPSLYINPEVSNDTWWVPGEQPVSDYQLGFATAAATVCGELEEMSANLGNQRLLGNFVVSCVQKWIDRTNN